MWPSLGFDPREAPSLLKKHIGHLILKKFFIAYASLDKKIMISSKGRQGSNPQKIVSAQVVSWPRARTLSKRAGEFVKKKHRQEIAMTIPPNEQPNHSARLKIFFDYPLQKLHFYGYFKEYKPIVFLNSKIFSISI